MAEQPIYAADTMPVEQRQLYADTIYNIDKAIRSLVPGMQYRSQEDINAFYRGIGPDVVNASEDPAVLFAQGAYTSALPAALYGSLGNITKAAPKPDYSKLPEEIRELAKWQDYSIPRKLYELGKQAIAERKELGRIISDNYSLKDASNVIAAGTAASGLIAGKGGSPKEITPEESERRYQEAMKIARQRNASIPNVAPTTAVPNIASSANQYLPQFTPKYIAEHTPYNEAYKYYLSTGDYESAERITDQFYKNVGMERPTIGAGSKGAVASAFGIALPTTERVAPPAAQTSSATQKPTMVPIYETITEVKKDKDGNPLLVGRRVKVGEKPASSVAETSTTTNQQSAAPDATAFEQRMKFIDEMRKAITKQFGFDPFESPHNKAVNYVEDVFNRLGYTGPGVHGDMDRLYAKKLAEFQAQQLEALNILDFGLKRYDSEHGLKIIEKPAHGGLLTQNNKIIANIKPDFEPKLTEAGAILNEKLYVLGKPVPYDKNIYVPGKGFRETNPPVPISAHGGALVGDKIYQLPPNPLESQPNKETMNNMVAYTDSRLGEIAKKFKIDTKEIEQRRSDAMLNKYEPGTPAYLEAVWGEPFRKAGKGQQFAEIIRNIQSPFTRQSATPIATPNQITLTGRRGSDGRIYNANGEATGYTWK